MWLFCDRANGTIDSYFLRLFNQSLTRHTTSAPVLPVVCAIFRKRIIYPRICDTRTQSVAAGHFRYLRAYCLVSSWRYNEPNHAILECLKRRPSANNHCGVHLMRMRNQEYIQKQSRSSSEARTGPRNMRQVAKTRIIDHRQSLVPQKNGRRWTGKG